MKDCFSGLIWDVPGSEFTKNIDNPVFCVYADDGEFCTRWFYSDRDEADSKFKRMLAKKDKLSLQKVLFEIMLKGNTIYSTPVCA